MRLVDHGLMAITRPVARPSSGALSKTQEAGLQGVMAVTTLALAGGAAATLVGGGMWALGKPAGKRVLKYGLGGLALGAIPLVSYYAFWVYKDSHPAS